MDQWKRANTDWMHQGKWGVMCHYLADVASAQEATTLDVDAWNQRVDRFNVQGLVGQLKEAGASWLILTIGQNSGFYCSPNQTYDNLVGVKPSRLSKRDPIGEVGDALTRDGRRLIAYLSSHAPVHHRDAVEALDCTPEWDAGQWGLKPGMYVRRRPVDDRLSVFQKNWEAIIREWSVRWGRNVSGWWIDGCYYADRMYRHADAPNFRSFAAAMKAGNPDSLVAFNPGIQMPIICHSECDDYTAGEINSLVTPCRFDKFERFKNGAQVQLLSYLADWWGSGQPRFSDELVVGYTRYINSFGGAVTWDVPITAEGKIPDIFVKQLKKIDGQR